MGQQKAVSRNCVLSLIDFGISTDSNLQNFIMFSTGADGSQATKPSKEAREEASKPVEEFEDWKVQGLDSLFEKTGGTLERESTKNTATLFKLSEKQVR